MAKRLPNGNAALALLANTIATGATLVALIFTFGGFSGAHFNPVVTVMDAFERGLPWRDTPHYVAAQIPGGIAGAVVAHLMFGLPPIFFAHHIRSGGPQVFSEFVATFCLMCVIWGCSRLRSNAVPFAVGAYITAAYWFTASTSFANPAVTVARSLSHTFSGIRPADAPEFVGAQFLGAFAATFFSAGLFPIFKLGRRKLFGSTIRIACNTLVAAGYARRLCPKGLTSISD
jgi:glycerol uptake facilitator-like aquaporin